MTNNNLNPKEAKFKRQQEYRLKTKYNMTLEQLERTLKRQDNKCMICKTELSHIASNLKGYSIDHCHETLKFRGILCQGCNLMLGYVNDSIEILQAAVDYLKKHLED